MRAPKTIQVVLAIAAVFGLVLTIAVMWGYGYDWRVGPLRIRVRDFGRPLAAATIASGFLFVHAWLRGGTRTPASALLVLCGLLALIASARRADATYAAAGDFALIESYTIHATNGRQFLGPYSRFGWNHPGPLYFYVIAPFYVLSGHRAAGLSAGALALNLGSLLAMIWVLLRMGRGVLAVVMASLSVVFMWRAETLVASQWNPHVVVLPIMALIVISAGMMTGRIWLLPAVALVATFIVQTHIGLAPTVLAVSAVGTISGALVLTHRFPGGGTRLWPPVNVTLWLLAVLWLLPIAQQLLGMPGNLTALWTFFILEERSGQAFVTGFRAWSDMLSALLRPDTYVPWGGELDVGEVWWSGPWAILQVTGVAAVAVRAALVREQFRFALAGLLVVASLLALWSATRIEGDIRDHLVFWIAGIGVLNTAVMVDAIIVGVWRRARSVTARVTGVMSILLFVVAASIGFRQLHLVTLRSYAPGIEPLAARRLADGIAMHDIGKPLVRIDHPAWGIAAGVLLQFQKRGTPFAVDDAWTFMFGDSAAPRGDEASVLTFATREARDRLMSEAAYEEIAERDGMIVLVLRGGADLSRQRR
jgi:hypothetical protein